MIKIMFICHGNICRSPMAEFVMNKLIMEKGLSDKIIARSCAVSREEIGNDIHRGTREILIKYDIPFSSRQAVQLTKADYERYDYLVAMDESNLRFIKRIIGADYGNKVSLLLSFAGEDISISDPWYTGDFERTYRDVLKGCKALLDKIQKEEVF